jgi:crotonobetainyl-CoA:carnitine CoA-transferase CaiB-like acyl-CoA transferase
MGPLDGVKVIEIASLAPAPFGCMILSDLGADVLRVERTQTCREDAPAPADPLVRGRRSVGLNLKDPEGVALLLRLVEQSDVLIEGFRPGVAERLGFGPEECLRRNPRLIFGRMTGWGQDGPLAPTAGHDIDYIAVSGVLHGIGRAGERPVPPLNLVGDFGGGGMLLALGVLAALLERERSGAGQVIDAAMTDGSALLHTFIYGLLSTGTWREERGSNLLDGGAPFYDTYETADGGAVAVGALESQFYAALLDGLGLDQADLPAQYDRSGWPVLRERFRTVFAKRTRDEWAEIFAGTDACVAPVLAPLEAARHPHNAARGTFTDSGGMVQPAPAPRFSRTPAAPTPLPPVRPGADTTAVLTDLGLSTEQISALRATGSVG